MMHQEYTYDYDQFKKNKSQGKIQFGDMLDTQSSNDSTSEVVNYQDQYITDEDAVLSKFTLGETHLLHRLSQVKENDDARRTLVMPGDVVVEDCSGYIQGPGIHIDSKRKRFISSLRGYVIFIDKLVYVQTLKRSKYIPQIGDVVIGRVDEILNDKWMIDIDGVFRGELPFCSIRTYFSQLRDKSKNQESARTIFKTGDLICCEVQRLLSSQSSTYFVPTLLIRDIKSNDSVASDVASDFNSNDNFNDSSDFNQSANFGKLSCNGCLVKINYLLTKNLKKHFFIHQKTNILLIVSCNGYVWISASNPYMKSIRDSSDEQISDNQSELLTKIDNYTRENLSRLRNCIIFLSSYSIILHSANIFTAFDVTTNLKLKPYDILKRSNSQSILKLFYELIR